MALCMPLGANTSVLAQVSIRGARRRWTPVSRGHDTQSRSVIRRATQRPDTSMNHPSVYLVCCTGSNREMRRFCGCSCVCTHPLLTDQRKIKTSRADPGVNTQTAGSGGQTRAAAPRFTTADLHPFEWARFVRSLHCLNVQCKDLSGIALHTVVVFDSTHCLHLGRSRARGPQCLPHYQMCCGFVLRVSQSHFRSYECKVAPQSASV